MSLEENKALVRRLFDAVNNQDVTTISNIAAADVADHLINGTIPFIEGTFGDHHIEVTEMLAEGDKVWAKLATRGGHTGVFHDLLPTGRHWTNTGVYFVDVHDGVITGVSGLFDDLNLVRQLGATLVLE